MNVTKNDIFRAIVFKLKVKLSLLGYKLVWEKINEEPKHLFGPNSSSDIFCGKNNGRVHQF